eukprot:COSAG02_NODE_2294_length_9198_cov_3.122321_4_plen_51_part_00
MSGCGDVRGDIAMQMWLVTRMLSRISVIDGRRPGDGVEKQCTCIFQQGNE